MYSISTHYRTRLDLAAARSFKPTPFAPIDLNYHEVSFSDLSTVLSLVSHEGSKRLSSIYISTVILYGAVN